MLSGHMIVKTNLSVSQQLNCARSACSLVAPWRAHLGCTMAHTLGLHHSVCSSVAP